MFFFLFYIIWCLPEFLRLGNLAWEFLGVLILVGGFLGVFDFCHHSIIPVTWNLEYLPWGWGELKGGNTEIATPAGSNKLLLTTGGKKI